MTVLRPGMCLLLAVVITGCTAVRGAPEPPRATSVALADPEALVEPAVIQRYVAETDPAKKKSLRNEIIDERILEIDNRFAAFEMDLWRQGVGSGIGTDWVLLALAATTATAGGVVVKAALGAASTAITGGKASFDKNAFFDKTLLAILAQMAAERQKVRAGIEQSKRLSTDEYTLFAAVSDLRRLLTAGTIPGGIQAVAVDAGAKATAADKDIKDIRTARFLRDDAGDKLRTFWKPDGTTIDPTNEAALKAWMQRHGLATGPGDITIFLRDEALADMRLRAARELLKQ